MSQSATQLIEDAIEASRRAVQFDTAGQQEAAASYFYTVAAQLLEKAAAIEGGQKGTALLDRAKEYRSRAEVLHDIDSSHQKRLVYHSEGKLQLERCYFLLQQGLDADEAGLKETAINLYSQAVELALKQIQNDEATRKKILKVATQALERAEVLKGM